MTEQEERPAGAPPATDQQQPSAPPARPPGLPGIGSIFTLAFLSILLPGVAVYLVTHALGLPLAPSTLLGLLTVIVCLAFYPKLLLRLGWVKKSPRRGAAGRTR